MGCTRAGMTLPRTGSFQLYLVTLGTLNRVQVWNPGKKKAGGGNLLFCCSQLFRVHPSLEKTRYTVDFPFLIVISLDFSYHSKGSPFSPSAIQEVSEFTVSLLPEVNSFVGLHSLCWRHASFIFSYILRGERAQNVVKDRIVREGLATCWDRLGVPPTCREMGSQFYLPV